MIQRKRGTGYRKAYQSEVDRLSNAGRIKLEGVDGDEEANTVTYWYRQRIEE